MTTRAWAFRIGIGLTLAGGLSSQQGPRPPVDRGVMEQRVRARFGAMVRAELELNADQLQKLEQVVMSFEDQRRALAQREMALRRRMRPADAANRSEQDAQEILREMVAIHEEEARLFRGEMDELRKTLTAAQALRFYEMRAQLQDRVQRLRQPAAGRPGPVGPGGPGGPGRLLPPDGPPPGR